MTVRPLTAQELRDLDADAPRPVASSARASDFGAALERSFAAASGALERADDAERAFVRGSGSIAAMVFERAQADVMLELAAAAASRTGQALSTILGMQV